MRSNIFQGLPEHPYHLSVGIVAIDSDGRIGVHQFSQAGVDRYLLPTETIERDESLEAAAKRGLREEFGAEAEIVGYLGAVLSTHTVDGASINKSTEYVVAKVSSWNESTRSTSDRTIGSRILWLRPEPLATRLAPQAEANRGSDLDQSEVLQRFQESSLNELLA